MSANWFINDAVTAIICFVAIIWHVEQTPAEMTHCWDTFCWTASGLMFLSVVIMVVSLPSYMAAKKLL